MKFNMGAILKAAITTAVAASLLSACGGGGGGSPAASIQSFPFQAGYKALIANGFSKPFTISGSCLGGGVKTAAAAATAATFGGAAALSSASSLTLSFTNCTPAPTAQTSISYFDRNYVPLGFISDGVFGVYLTPPTIPTVVSVGQTGAIGTENLYTDSTKATSSGTQVLSFIVQADTSSTAIINLATKSYNAAAMLTETEQDLYRIDAGGTLTPISTDLQYTNGSTTHLVLTYY